MNIYTSYFYQIRYFPRNLVPISTAVWDPKWFHDFKGQEHTFVDKRGVINGIRFDKFAPGKGCSGLCHGLSLCVHQDPRTCLFLRRYYEQLCKLNAFEVVHMLEEIGGMMTSAFNLDSAPDFAFIVYETPDNSCSERAPIQRWFQENGYSVVEWERGM